MLPIFNTASEVGYGATIAALSSFARIRDSLLGLAPEYPLISEAVSINILAGITGSASGGLSIALDALAESYLAVGGAGGDLSRAPASGRHHGQRRLRHVAAQRRGHHPAGHLPTGSSPVLSGHRGGGGGRPVCRHVPGRPAGVYVRQLLGACAAERSEAKCCGAGPPLERNSERPPCSGGLHFDLDGQGSADAGAGSG